MKKKTITEITKNKSTKYTPKSKLKDIPSRANTLSNVINKKNLVTPNKSKYVLDIGKEEETDKTLSQPQPQPIQTRYELLCNEINKLTNEPKKKKIKNSRKYKTNKKEIMIESINKIKNKEIVVTQVIADDNTTYYYDEFNNLLDHTLKVIGVYRDNKIYAFRELVFETN